MGVLGSPHNVTVRLACVRRVAFSPPLSSTPTGAKMDYWALEVTHKVTQRTAGDRS